MMAIENLQRIVPPLTEWFRAFARDLPWRSDPLPYYVWISEIMLQQTRVEAVKPYFRRFTEALPDVKALADCPEEDLFKLWEGPRTEPEKGGAGDRPILRRRDTGGL